MIALIKGKKLTNPWVNLIKLLGAQLSKVNGARRLNKRLKVL